MKKLEAAEGTSVQASRLPRIRLHLPLRSADKARPQLADLQRERKPVQTEFDWPTNQLRLFKKVSG
jgi:hypothetical protein